MNHYFDKWVTEPARDAQRIAEDMEVYRRLRFPGARASVDCTHVRWNKCPDTINHTGKEGFPTIAYEVAVNHSKHIRSVTVGHPGTRNDKTIIRLDDFMMAIHNRELS